MARHLSVPSISSLALEVQRVVGLYQSSLRSHCLRAEAGGPTVALSTVRSLLAAASDYMDGKLQDDLDQVLRIASTCSDEILDDATDWVTSVNGDIHSLVLKVMDYLESRTTQPTSPWPPASLSSPPQSSPSPPTQATTGPSSPLSSPDSSGSSSSRFCQDTIELPGVTDPPLCFGAEASGRIRCPGGDCAVTLPWYGDSCGRAAALQLPHHTFLSNHRQAGGGGSRRDENQPCSQEENKNSEIEDRCIPRTQRVESNNVLLQGAPVQPPPRILPTSLDTRRPVRCHLTPPLDSTLLRRPRRVQRPRLLGKKPCTPYIFKLCKGGKKFKSILKSRIQLTDTLELRQKRVRALTPAGVFHCRRLHGPKLQPEPPREPHCSLLSGCHHRSPGPSLCRTKPVPVPVPQSQARTPEGDHLVVDHLGPSSNEIRLNPSKALHRGKNCGVTQPIRWPYAPLYSRPIPPDPGVKGPCRTGSWAPSPSHPGPLHAGHIRLLYDPGGPHAPAPDDLHAHPDHRHDVLHPLHHEAHDDPATRHLPRVPSVAVLTGLHRGLSNDDLRPGNSHATATCAASQVGLLTPKDAAILETRPQKLMIANPNQEQVIPRPAFKSLTCLSESNSRNPIPNSPYAMITHNSRESCNFKPQCLRSHFNPDDVLSFDFKPRQGLETLAQSSGRQLNLPPKFSNYLFICYY